MGSNRFLIPAAAAAIILACSPMLLTQPRTSEVKQSNEAARAETAGSVLAELMDAPDQGLPEALLKKAVGIAVIPHVVKGAFGITLSSRTEQVRATLDSYSSKGPGIFQPAPPDHLN